MVGQAEHPGTVGPWLTDKEKSFMARITNNKRLFFASSIVSVAIAIVYFIYYALIVRDLTAVRFVVVILLLLSGRAHLKQYKCAVIFGKLRTLLAESEGEA